MYRYITQQDINFSPYVTFPSTFFFFNYSPFFLFFFFFTRLFDDDFYRISPFELNQSHVFVPKAAEHTQDEATHRCFAHWSKGIRMLKINFSIIFFPFPISRPIIRAFSSAYVKTVINERRQKSSVSRPASTRARFCPVSIHPWAFVFIVCPIPLSHQRNQWRSTRERDRVYK